MKKLSEYTEVNKTQMGMVAVEGDVDENDFAILDPKIFADYGWEAVLDEYGDMHRNIGFWGIYDGILLYSYSDIGFGLNVTTGEVERHSAIDNTNYQCCMGVVRDGFVYSVTHHSEAVQSLVFDIYNPITKEYQSEALTISRSSNDGIENFRYSIAGNYFRYENERELFFHRGGTNSGISIYQKINGVYEFIVTHALGSNAKLGDNQTITFSNDWLFFRNTAGINIKNGVTITNEGHDFRSAMVGFNGYFYYLKNDNGYKLSFFDPETEIETQVPDFKERRYSDGTGGRSYISSFDHGICGVVIDGYMHVVILGQKISVIKFPLRFGDGRQFVIPRMPK